MNPRPTSQAGSDRPGEAVAARAGSSPAGPILRRPARLRVPLAFLLAQAGLLVYTTLVVGPLLWTALTSLKSSLELFRNIWGLPQSWLWSNYASAWTNARIGSGFVNSLLVSGVAVPVILLLAAMAAFAITRIDFRGRRALLTLFVSGLMIPQALVLVPLFILLGHLGLLNTRTGLILVYVAFAFPFNIFLMVPFFNAVPRALEEAALADGASHAQVFWRVDLPLARTGLVIAGVFQFFADWGEYVLAYTVLSSDRLRTLPLAVADMVLRQQYQTDWGALFAGLIIALVPVILIYALFQRWISEGILSGSIKG
ncbi:carbohydrate ABC transporter permease [Limnochorda pilosa]|uniref:Sugar ABC transporter permease n=1 Tax=Limnochorda pilosa TaxID=1555112 RepID=A0A0K2SL35_LIMPI|nr:carbohydrate ABC transporter permease [Limnochorda pilosa]BAS27831.1 sugar ABC transporter permease [Limnochorda pilosa]